MTGILHGISSGSVVVDHTTASATVAREVYEAAAAKDVGFLDAPLSGGQAGAENGQLTIMIGGDQAVYERALPMMDSYAKACTLIGPVGSGQLAKMVNQICIAGVVQGLSEGLHFCKTCRTRSGESHWRDFERCGAVLANGKPLGNHGQRRIRLWFCR